MDDIRMDPLIWSKGRVIVSHFHFIPQNDPFFTKKQHVNMSRVGSEAEHEKC